MYKVYVDIFFELVHQLNLHLHEITKPTQKQELITAPHSVSQRLSASAYEHEF